MAFPTPPPLPDVRWPHIPVLYQETLSALAPHPDGHYLDGTLGMGGHSWGLLHASSPHGRLLALDQDPGAIAVARARLEEFPGRWVVERANFDQMARVAAAHGVSAFDGILLDLGFSSMQMDDPARGLSFRAEAPLDMRLDPAGTQRAEELVNGLEEQALADLLYQYGEEHQSRRIARAIVRARPIQSAQALGEVIARAVRRPGDRIHPATKSFQALRIAVNDELGALERALPQALSLLKAGGVLAVITFHSLEDRIVKQFMRREATDCLCPPQLLHCLCDHHASLHLPTRKAIAPQEAEIRENPRARSARLRVAVRVEDRSPDDAPPHGLGDD